ncbi:MAG TPA: ornithine carbamoyltransferase [Actinomycetota bacterium]|nr:ornithine carbamoyltransferase [Actinomycetota bacterium]
MEERDFLSIDDVSPEELRYLVDSAAALKRKPDALDDTLKGRRVALIFEKPSTRTRVSFEAAVTSLGGSAIVLRGDELQLGRGETIEDTGRVLSRYVSAIVVRTFGQDRLERLAHAASVPVVNALSDFSHPCQCLADLQTIAEKKGSLDGLTLTYVGDGNNVAHSLMFGGTKMGMHVRIGCPEGYEPFPQVVDRCREIGESTGGSVTVTHSPEEAARDADVLYTDVWASMGQESEAESRVGVFEPYRLDSALVDVSDRDSIVMHCLPAHRGEEISADVIDGPRSVVWDQAENRLHAQKALLAWLLG